MISFDSDGWYGVISDGVDFENMSIVAQAVVDMLHEQGIDHPLFTVGYDTRFLSREYAWQIQKVLTGNGAKVLFHKLPISTSILSYSTKKFNCNLGIMVTGIGRPARYSGLTFRNSLGVPISTRWLAKLFQFLYRKYPRSADETRSLLEIIDVTEDYKHLLEKYIDFDLIRSKKPVLIYDAYYGSTGDFLESFLKGKGVGCRGIRIKPNPGFNGNAPQPVDRNMSILSRAVGNGREIAGFFFNGDGSRLGMVGEDGAILNFSQFSSLIFEEWICKHGMTDLVLTGPTTPRLVESLAEYHRGKCRSWPRDEGELCGDMKWIRWENLSMAFGRVVPDFDAVLQSLIFVQGLCRCGFDLKGWLKSVESTVDIGYIMERYISVSDKLWNGKKKWIIDGSIPLSIAGNIDYIEEATQTKLYLSDGSWIVFEYEHQENTLRIVVESENSEKTSGMMNDIIKWIRTENKFDYSFF